MMNSDDETEEYSSWKGVPATIVCINVFDPGQHKTSEVAYAATCRMVRQYLRTSSSHFIGVCLFGTESSNSTIFGIQSVDEVFALALPTLDDFKKLKKVQLDSVKQAQDFIMSDVLWYCSKSFASCKRQLSSRNVIVLSRFDTPPTQADQKPALKRVVDLVDSNIDIKLINIAQEEYQIDQFYTNFLIEAKKSEDVELPSHMWDHVEIEKQMHQQSHRHLAVARLSFEIGGGLAIGVGVYSLLKSNAMADLKKFDLQRDTNTVLTRVNKTVKIKVTNDSGMDVDEEESKPMPVLKSELIHYQIYGGERVEFTDEEMKVLKNPFGPPMMKLLGFKPAAIICKEKWFFKPGYFLFPNENVIEGSIVAFKALHQACVETKMVAICVLCTRVNAKPNIVALSPTTKPLGLDVNVGFDVIRVPFVENVRNIPIMEEDDNVEIPETNKNVMKDILKSLQFEFKPDMFENPKLQSQYRAIEAIALEDEEIDPFVDTTKPSSDRFQDLKDDVFQELFGPFSTVPVKKPTTSRAGGPASKKVKIEGVDELLLEQRLSDRKLNDFTVAQLKDILKLKDIKNLPALTGLKKSELVELVYKHCK